MSPVAMWGTPHSRASSRACVPLPAPGGPRKATRTALRPPREGTGSRAALRPLEEALVVAHEQVRLHLAHGVEGDADHDEQARAAEVERHVEPAHPRSPASTDAARSGSAWPGTGSATTRRSRG